MKKQLFLLSLISAATLLGQNEEPPVYELEPLVVQSSPLTPEVADLTQAWSALDGEALERLKAQTIGETLANEPGVSQSFYGPNASRPIIRGLDGQRVRVLQNGLDAFDVSSASVDHAVAVDPMLTERVEILRGSSALLYGANAIGGVVNTIDKTIPTGAPVDKLNGETRLSYTSVNQGWNTGGAIFGGNGDFVVQANGTFRKIRDYDIPDFTLPDGSRTNRIDNSQSETWTGGLGGSYLFENGYAGVAYSHFDTQYGVPNEEAPTIELERHRVEARSAIAPDSVDWLENIELQFAYGNYRHNEIESSGEVGTTYKREGFEQRLALVHSFGEVKGVAGLQGNFDQTRIEGEENPFAGATGRNPNIAREDAQRLALFIIEEYDVNNQWSLNGGTRLETLLRQYEGASDRDDFNVSASGGVVFRPAQGWSISGNVNYTERQPETFELYSDGPHPATGDYEVGDSTLGKESAIGLEMILRRTKGSVTGQLSAFYTHFDDYIYLADTGRELDPEGNDPAITGEEALTERVFRGVTAEFYGFESEVTWRVIEENNWTIDLRGFGDVIWAKNISDNTNLPRTPPWRLGAGFDVNYRAFTFGMDLTHTGEQNKTAPGEASTDGYTLLGARVAYTWATDYTDAQIFCKATNLTDELAQVHTSFLRDTALLPGRNFEAGVNVRF